MNPENAPWAALLLLALVLGSNLIMVGIVRSFSRGDARWLQALMNNLGKPLEHKHAAMDELRRRVQDLSEEDKQEKEN
jgi:hypothetical protein